MARPTTSSVSSSGSCSSRSTRSQSERNVLSCPSNVRAISRSHQLIACSTSFRNSGGAFSNRAAICSQAGAIRSPSDQACRAVLQRVDGHSPCSASVLSAPAVEGKSSRQRSRQSSSSQESLVRCSLSHSTNSAGSRGLRSNVRNSSPSPIQWWNSSRSSSASVQLGCRAESSVSRLSPARLSLPLVSAILASRSQISLSRTRVQSSSSMSSRYMLRGGPVSTANSSSSSSASSSSGTSATSRRTVSRVVSTDQSHQRSSSSSQVSPSRCGMSSVSEAAKNVRRRNRG